MKKNNEMLDTYQEKTASLSEQQLSEEELQLIEATRPEIDRSTLPPHDNSDLAKAKRYVKKNKFSVLFVVITIVLLLAVIGGLIFMIIRMNKNKLSKDDFSITIGNEKPISVKNKDMVIDEKVYFDMNLIASYADLVVSGGNGRLKFMCPDGTYVRFENGADTATVNGTRVSLEGTATITAAKGDAAGKCLVPLSFVQKLFSHTAPNESSQGLKVIFYSKDNSIIIGKVVYENGDSIPISFSSDCFDAADNTFMKKNQDKYPDISFAYTKNTLLVNKSNPLGSDFEPEGLLSLNEIGCPVVKDREFLLEENAAKSLKTMVDDMYSALNGSESILVTSAYRSYERQVILFERYVESYIQDGMTREEAEKLANVTSARPGQSEHQSGLCVDFIQEGMLELDERFENTKAFEWLYENAHKYGFIIRYPREKVEITGYDYEPWHYRFVGIDAATVIFEDNICLEEYLAKY